MDHPAVIVRGARREDVPAVVRLLADDVLEAQRERVEEPVAPVYLTRPSTRWQVRRATSCSSPCAATR